MKIKISFSTQLHHREIRGDSIHENLCLNDKMLFKNIFVLQDASSHLINDLVFYWKRYFTPEMNIKLFLNDGYPSFRGFEEYFNETWQKIRDENAQK